MALSCLVTTTGVRVSVGPFSTFTFTLSLPPSLPPSLPSSQEPEDLASSVAHSLQLMFYDLELTSEPLPQGGGGEEKEGEGEEEGESEEKGEVREDTPSNVTSDNTVSIYTEYLN